MEGGGRRVVVNNYDLQQVTIQENMNFLIPFEETNVLTFFSSSSSSSLSSPSFPIHNSSSTTNTTHAPLGFPNNLQGGGPLGSKVLNDDQDNFRGGINNDAHSSSWWRSSSGSGESKNKVKIRRKLREPRFCFQTKSDVDVLDDGYKWRKYGQKIVKNSLHPSWYQSKVTVIFEEVKMEATVTFEGDMFKLTTDNFSYWKPMMEDHLYCKDLHEPIIMKDKPEGKDDKAREILNTKAISNINHLHSISTS